MRKTLPLLSLLVAAALVPAACASKDKPPVVPSTSLDAGTGDAGDAGPTTSGSGAPSASASAVAPPSASASAPGLPASLVEVIDLAVDTAIKQAAVTSAPGMAAEGAPLRATLAASEHVGMVVTLQPNRCYTVVGFSPPGQVAALDVKLLAPPLYNVPAGASGVNDKNAPVLGRGKAALCPLLPIAVPYKIDVSATKGAGRMGVQLFSRAK